jgi:PAS domain S-box-containing protein
MMYDKRGITSTITWIAGIVAVVVTLVLPIGYFAVSYQYLMGSLDAEAEMTSRIVTELINANPEHWHFEQLRLEDLLARRMQDRPKETRRILNLQNKLVAESSTLLKPPLITRSFALMDAGVTVGMLEIQTSLLQLLLRTGLAALFGLSCGLGIFVTLRILPLRAVALAEKSLLESEERYRRLVDNAPDAILVYNNELILYANSAAFLLFGTERPEQLIGQPIVSIIHPDFRELAGEHFDLAENEDLSGSRLDLRLIRFDGAPIDVAAVGIRIIYKGKSAVQIIFHDITERKQFQDELADKVEQMEAALAKVKQLEGIIPICMYCKKIRDDKESWQQLESYITQHSEALFSHGICPDCFQKVYNETAEDLEGIE